MKNQVKKLSAQFIVTALFVGFAITSSQVSRADNGEWQGHKHGGEWKSAAAKVCKGQAAESDKKACFKQLKTQRKAALAAFDQGFTYAPAAPAVSTPGQ